MDLRHLRYFVAVAEERHVTRAAVRLGMAQPPLSQQIRALERELGVTLLVRRPGGVEPTAAGAAFLEEARATLAAADRAAARARQVAVGASEELRLGLTTSASMHRRVHALLGALVAARPALALDIHEGNAAELTEALLVDRVQVVLMRAPVARPTGIRFEELLRERLMLALPAAHPLAAHRAVPLASLDGERIVLVRRRAAPGLYADAVEACRAAGFEPRIVAEAGRMLTGLTLVAAGIGVSFVPGSMRGVGIAGVVYRPIRGALLMAPLTLALREGDERPPVRALAELAQTVRTR